MMRRWKGRCIHLDHRCPVPSVESLIGQRFDCELKRKGVTLFLLWEEYKSTHPNGFQYSWFCQHYRAYAGKLDLVMRQTHRAGETMFVDYAGQTVPVVNRDTGELREAQIFVAVLGASSYTFARASWTQSLPDWIDAHCRAFTFFGGVTDTLVCPIISKPVSPTRTATSPTSIPPTPTWPPTTGLLYCRPEWQNLVTSLLFHDAPCSVCGTMDVDSAAAASSCRVWWNVSLPQLALYMQYRRPSVVMIPRSMRESLFALPRARTVPGVRPSCSATSAAVLKS